LSFRATRRTRARSLGALVPALCPERVSLAAFPSADPLPSTDSAAPPWALFASFAGTTGSSDFPRSSITGLRPRPCPHDPPYHHHKRVIVGSPGSRAWRLRACTGSWTPRGPPTARESAAGRCCLPLVARASAPRLLPISGPSAVSGGHDGRGGQSSPRVSMARAIRASGVRNPYARRVISRSWVLTCSVRAFDRPC